jgi:hypothetical protein
MIYCEKIVLGYYSDCPKKPMSFFKESITCTNKREKLEVDDHVSFINFYMENYLHKKNYLEENSYQYEYKKKNEVFYGKQIIIDNKTKEIVTYNIIRQVTDKEHLIICAKIIREIDNKIK